MSTDVQYEGDFSGTDRHASIHGRLFSLLSEYGDPSDEENVFYWMEDELGWSQLTETELPVFASLARAFPGDNFRYEASLIYEGGGLEETYHTIQYENGALNLCTVSLFEDEKNGKWDMNYGCHVGRNEDSFGCSIDKEGSIIEERDLSDECLKLEKEKMEGLLRLAENGEADPSDLVNLGILYETGLAGISKSLTAAWDYYLKAAQTRDEEAVEFVKEIFSEESAEEFHKLLADKQIGKESFAVLLELALEEKRAELTAELLDYKNSLQ